MACKRLNKNTGLITWHSAALALPVVKRIGNGGDRSPNQRLSQCSSHNKLCSSSQRLAEVRSKVSIACCTSSNTQSQKWKGCDCIEIEYRNDFNSDFEHTNFQTIPIFLAHAPANYNRPIINFYMELVSNGCCGLLCNCSLWRIVCTYICIMHWMRYSVIAPYRHQYIDMYTCASELYVCRQAGG